LTNASGEVVLVFGASGRTGRLVVEESLEGGHEVLAFVRNESRLGLSNPRLDVLVGDVTVASDVDAAVQKAGVVVSALGQAPNSPREICSLAARNIVGSMTRHGVKRLICLSDYGNGDTRTKGLYARFLWVLIREHLEDKEKMEEAIRSSGLDWTIVRPTILTDGPRTGAYKVGPDIRIGLVPKVSRRDVADFMVKQITDRSFVGASPSISR